jgi:hypothetical protein
VVQQAVVFVTDILWRWMKGTAVDRFVSRMGRKSLAMYVAHVFVVGLVVSLSYKLTLGLWQWLYIPLTIVLVWSVAWGMERIASARKTREREERRAPLFTRPFAGNRGMAVTAGVLMVVLSVLSRPNGTNEDPVDGLFDSAVDGWDLDDGQFLAKASPRFLSPITPGILSPAGLSNDDADDVEVMANAGIARTGRTTSNDVAGSPFRRQL